MGGRAPLRVLRRFGTAQRRLMLRQAIIHIARRKMKRCAIVMNLRLLAIIAAWPNALSLIQGRHAAIGITG